MYWEGGHIVNVLKIQLWGAFVQDNEPTIVMSEVPPICHIFLLPRTAAPSFLYIASHSLKLNFPGKAKYPIGKQVLVNQTGIQVCLVQGPLSTWWYFHCLPPWKSWRWILSEAMVGSQGVDVLSERVSSGLNH